MELETGFTIFFGGIMIICIIVIIVLSAALLFAGILLIIDFLIKQYKKHKNKEEVDPEEWYTKINNFRRIIEIIEVGQSYDYIVGLFYAYKYRNRIIKRTKSDDEEELFIVYEINDDTYCPRVYLHFNNGKLTRLSTEKL